MLKASYVVRAGMPSVATYCCSRSSTLPRTTQLGSSMTVPIASCYGHSHAAWILLWAQSWPGAKVMSRKRYKTRQQHAKADNYCNPAYKPHKPTKCSMIMSDSLASCSPHTALHAQGCMQMHIMHTRGTLHVAGSLCINYQLTVSEHDACTTADTATAARVMLKEGPRHSATRTDSQQCMPCE